MLININVVNLSCRKTWLHYEIVKHLQRNLKHPNMNDNKNTILNHQNIDDEIRNYIQQKKEENNALKKLLSALEDTKKVSSKKNNA